MLSEFRSKKLTGLFRFWDIDHDGRISAQDFDQIVLNYLESSRVAPGSPQHEEIASRYQGFWGQLKAFDADGDGAVEGAEYIAGMEAWLADYEGFMASIGNMLDSYYKVIDRDGDGRITQEELVTTYTAHGLDQASAEDVFGKLDRDGDGAISQDEMAKNLEEAYYSEETDAPGNWLALPEV